MEMGDFEAGGQGRRSDIHTVAALILSGVDMRKIACEYPVVYVKFNKGLHALSTISHLNPYRGPPNIQVFWGPTGTGKSRRAHDTWPEAYWWPRPQNTASYSIGYAGQSTIILDDFYGWIPFDLLLRLCDRYPLILNAQGIGVQCKATCIVITSNREPSSWYSRVDPAPLLRRISEYGTITHFPSLQGGPDPSLAAM